jgi:hypothetical protein
METVAEAVGMRWRRCTLTKLVSYIAFPKAARDHEPISYRGTLLSTLLHAISYRQALVSTLLHATVYKFLHNLLNVLVQIANKLGLQTKMYCFNLNYRVLHPVARNINCK